MPRLLAPLACVFALLLAPSAWAGDMPDSSDPWAQEGFYVGVAGARVDSQDPWQGVLEGGVYTPLFAPVFRVRLGGELGIGSLAAGPWQDGSNGTVHGDVHLVRLGPVFAVDSRFCDWPRLFVTTSFSVGVVSLDYDVWRDQGGTITYAGGDQVTLYSSAQIGLGVDIHDHAALYAGVRILHVKDADTQAYGAGGDLHPALSAEVGLRFLF